MIKTIRANQPELFTDSKTITPVAGADAGIQLDIFGGGHYYHSLPTEMVTEATSQIRILKSTRRFRRW